MSSIIPFSNEDPEKLFICPYDKVHVVRACRFNQHLRKCRRNHGGIGFLICSFNQSHHIPESQYDHHIRTCPDQCVIQQDIDHARGIVQFTLPEVDHHPKWNKPESNEDWDEEFEDHQRLMQYQSRIKEMEAEVAMEDEEDLGNMEILPEHPHNWESLTATQKKNYKRRYKRQQEKLKEKGLTPADFQKSKNPEDWTDAEREAKIQLMLSIYPPPKIGGSFIDYKSVLNQYCQKNRINQPKYMEVPSCFMGFASEVIVNGQTYRSHGTHKTKKDAAHSAAKWALMALEVPEEEKTQLNQRPRPARTAQDMALLRSAHEVGLLQQAGYVAQVPKPGQQQRQQAQMQSVSRPLPSQAAAAPATNSPMPDLLPPAAFSKQADDLAQSMKSLSVNGGNNDDTWQTVPTKRSGRPGRGRGTALVTY